MFDSRYSPEIGAAVGYTPYSAAGKFGGEIDALYHRYI